MYSNLQMENSFNNILIVVAVLCVIGVIVLYFVINKDDKSSVDFFYNLVDTRKKSGE